LADDNITTYFVYLRDALIGKILVYKCKREKSKQESELSDKKKKRIKHCRANVKKKQMAAAEKEEKIQGTGG